MCTYLSLENVHCLLCSSLHLIREQSAHSTVKLWQWPELVEATPGVVPCLRYTVPCQLYHSHQRTLEKILVSVHQLGMTVVLDRGTDELGSRLSDFAIAVPVWGEENEREVQHIISCMHEHGHYKTTEGWDGEASRKKINNITYQQLLS